MYTYVVLSSFLFITKENQKTTGLRPVHAQAIGALSRVKNLKATENQQAAHGKAKVHKPHAHMDVVALFVRHAVGPVGVKVLARIIRSSLAIKSTRVTKVRRPAKKGAPTRMRMRATLIE